jgi:hypothetical protein
MRQRPRQTYQPSEDAPIEFAVHWSELIAAL